MGLPPLQEKFLRSGSTVLISFAMHKNRSDLVTHVSDGPFLSSNGNKYILVAIDYVSKWVEAQAFPTNDAQNVVNFLKRIIYGKSCHLPIELEHKAYGALKTCNIDLTKAGANTFLQINELEELRLDACESSISYKWIKTPTEYGKEDKDLLFNSQLRLFPGKLKSRWYRLFTISRDMKGGAIELCDEEGNKFIVNKQRVKPYQKYILDFDVDDDVTLND
ncbi:reverse transcriptase domain-containing protein [Tanacetum coccineum]|uniref:Reverse transcriptase domain-containing protein n=1 Tax=Tanacetum coccineum TaxID=301880 RepID=A0ABQ4WJR0_9ASTR